MILLVDDDVEAGKVVIQMLYRLGYVALSINDPVYALTLFSNAPERFDAVIVDEMMPGMRGTAVARQLIQTKDDLPVILVTGYGYLLTGEEAKASGIRETLTKPVLMKELKSALDRLQIKKRMLH